eukprot:NODE_5068_length_605_cov_82.838129_g4374_i0.p1 GENE.NODE_5068_length_605_cov_82.838129_g4374_i0~~NODE_5068_length_605_cov_82.838129_g4374_i0.p1  ORF type:complete len:121 (-),score=36.42 NODE_5068_length_605_cov_82.838129_g4374_i0:105-467(-)
MLSVDALAKILDIADIKNPGMVAMSLCRYLQRHQMLYLGHRYTLLVGPILTQPKPEESAEELLKFAMKIIEQQREENKRMREEYMKMLQRCHVVMEISRKTLAHCKIVALQNAKSQSVEK